MNEDLIAETREEMGAVIEVVHADMASVKTGRAKPNLVDQVQVEVYETRMPLIELATITAPDPNLLIIQPWDSSIVEQIVKAISKSDLNLSPIVDGTLVRITIPPLTEERREDLVKLVGQKIESGRVLLRQARQETKKKIEALEGEPGVSEDDVHRLLEEMEEVTDEFVKKIEEIGKTKEEELRRI